MFTEEAPAVCATASMNHVGNSPYDADADADAATLQKQKSPVCHQRTQQIFDACGPYKHSDSAVQQKLCSASKNFNIFQTTDLELTDADLEFNL